MKVSRSLIRRDKAYSSGQLTAILTTENYMDPSPAMKMWFCPLFHARRTLQQRTFSFLLSSVFRNFCASRSRRLFSSVTTFIDDDPHQCCRILSPTYSVFFSPVKISLCVSLICLWLSTLIVCVKLVFSFSRGGEFLLVFHPSTHSSFFRILRGCQH